MRVSACCWMRAGLCAGLFALAPARVLAQAEEVDPADAVGFGAADPTSAPASESPSEASPPATVTSTTEVSPFSYAGFYRLQTALWTERTQPSRIAKLRSVLGARVGYGAPLPVRGHHARIRALASGRVEYDLAYQFDREVWSEPTLETYELTLIPDEVLAAVDIGPLELAFGKQIVNLGQGEVLSVLDTTNPRDQREPAAADPDELRLSVLMTRATLAIGPHRAELLLVHEPYFGMLPPPTGIQSPLRALLLDQPGGDLLAQRELRYDQVPDRNPLRVSALQPYARFTYVGSGFDLHVLAASLLDPLGVASLPPPAEFAEPAMELPVYHPRFTRFGQSGSLPFDAFVLRWELAFDLQRPLTLRVLDSPFVTLSAERRSQWSGLLGLSYIPVAGTSAGLELQQGYVIDSPERDDDRAVELLWPVEAPQLALRFDHRLLRDRAWIQFVLLLIGIDPLNAFVARGEVGYALSDTLALTFGYLGYVPSETEFGPFYGLGRNDRIYANLRWDFTLQ